MFGKAKSESDQKGLKKKAVKEKNKRQKKQREAEPQTLLSPANTVVWNYRVYELTAAERLLAFLAAFLAGAFTGYLFFGGLAKDSFGEATWLTYVLNTVISGSMGAAAGILVLPMAAQMKKEKKQKNLKLQFVDLLDSLSTSLMAGKNVDQSFLDAKKDLIIQYSEEADIVKELDVILGGLYNNIPIEDMLLDFGRRSGIDDIESFGNVFETSYQTGGNIQDVIQNTVRILSEKAEIEQEIETKLTANKNEQRILNVMPIVLVALIKGSNPDFARNFATVPGILASIFGIFCFLLSFYTAKKIMDIRI